MTNTQSTTADNNDNNKSTHTVEPVRKHRGHRRSTVVAASLLALGGVAVAAAVVTNADRDTSLPSTPTEEASALLSGDAFDTAVGQAVNNVDQPTSALLDGWAFQQAIEAAVAAIDWDVWDVNDDGPAFQEAIDEAVADLEG